MHESQLVILPRLRPHMTPPCRVWALPIVSGLVALILGCTDAPVAPLPVPEPPQVAVPASTHPIVFSSLRDSTFSAGGFRNSEIIAAREDGTDLINLSRHSANDSDPSWSPDGRFVAFASNRNGVADPGYAPTFDIFVMRDDGTDVRQLTSDSMEERYPSWSPDGKKILYQSQRESAVRGPGFFRPTDLFVLHLDGSRVFNLTATPTQNESRGAWSPDGKTIAYTRRDSTGTQIFLVNADGTNPRPLRPRDPNFVDEAPVWSPDGKRIAFSAGNVNHPPFSETYVILSVNVDGSDPRILTGLGYNSNRYPSWSPDGSRIVYTTDFTEESWGKYSRQNIAMMNSDGSGKSVLTKDIRGRNETAGPQVWKR